MNGRDSYLPGRPWSPDGHDDEPDTTHDGVPLSIEVVETENPVVASLFAPDGSVLVELHERPTVPFGFTT